MGFGGFKVRSASRLGGAGDLLHMRRVSGDATRHLESSYTTGVMVSIVWTKEDRGAWESGLFLVQAPGSMRTRWYKELLAELGLDERDVFSRRATRRGECRLPALLSTSALPSATGLVFDLSAGGALFAGTAAPLLGSTGSLQVTWGADVAHFPVTVVGVRPAEQKDLELKVLHSLKFEATLPKTEERILSRWLEELMRHA